MIQQTLSSSSKPPPSPEQENFPTKLQHSAVAAVPRRSGVNLLSWFQQSWAGWTQLWVRCIAGIRRLSWNLNVIMNRKSFPIICWQPSLSIPVSPTELRSKLAALYFQILRRSQFSCFSLQQRSGSVVFYQYPPRDSMHHNMQAVGHTNIHIF